MSGNEQNVGDSGGSGGGPIDSGNGTGSGGGGGNGDGGEGDPGDSGGAGDGGGSGGGPIDPPGGTGSGGDTPDDGGDGDGGDSGDDSGDDAGSGDGGDQQPDLNIARDHFGDVDPKEPGELGDRFKPGVYDPDDGFESDEQDTANMRAGEGKLVTRIPEHPLNHDKWKSMDSIERNGPDDPGRLVEYKEVKADSDKKFESQLKNAFDKFDPQPDQSRLSGDVVIDGRKAGLSEDNVMGKLMSRLGRMIRDDSPKLPQLGQIEIYLGDGSKIMYRDGTISRFVDGVEEILRKWDPEQKRWIDPDDPGPDDAVPAQ